VESYYPRIMQLKPLPRKRMSASQRASGATVQVPTPVALFPRYAFVHFDVRSNGWGQPVTQAGGGLLCREGKPVFLPTETIEAIRRRENNGIIPGKDSVRAIFNIGDRVTVTDGPFAAFPGIVERGLDCPIESLDPSLRIKIGINMFGRATPVELEYWQVAKYED
jgi:transcriptional antiterminator NusG